MSVKLGNNDISNILKGSEGTGGTTNYNDLTNKPQINSVPLVGNLSSSELGITANNLNVYEKNEVDENIRVATSNLVNQDYLSTQLSVKADTSYVNNQLALKANSNDVYTKDEIPSVINQNTTNKADKSYVDSQLETKADKTNTYTKEEVATAIETATSGIDTKLATKANVSDVYTRTDTDSKISEATSTKADTTYVNEQLALKSDKADTYTKEEVNNLVDNQTVAGDTLPIGSVTTYAGTSTPENWLLCDGREVSRTSYSQLFNIIGSSYGDGDGKNTFNLPNLSFEGTETKFYIIKAKQSSGVVATVVDTLESSSTTDALSANQGRILANNEKNYRNKTIMLTKSTNQNITNSYVQLTLDGQYGDTDIFTNNNGQITIKNNFRFLNLLLNINFKDSTQFFYQIFKNDVQMQNGWSGSMGNYHMICRTITNIKAGDVIIVKVYSSSQNNQAVGISNTYLIVKGWN